MRIGTLLSEFRRRREEGQVLVLFAAGIVGFIALVGLAVDAGSIVFTRTDLQKTADAAALAASQDLPSTTNATSAANVYVGDNVAGATAAVSFQSIGTDNDTVSVTVNKKANAFFLQVLGVDGWNISATAKVRVASYTGGNGLVPFGLVASNDSNSTLLQNPCFDGWTPTGEPRFKSGQSCTLKTGAGENSGGDFGALSLDGAGADTYRENIAKGSTGTYKKGDQVPSETGAMAGPTKQGMQDRLDEPLPAGCATLNKNQVIEYTTRPDGSTAASVRPECYDHPHIILIPVVDKIDNPEMSTILGFAFMWVSNVGTQGGHTKVTGEFLEFVTAIPGGIYDGNDLSGTTIAMLVE